MAQHLRKQSAAVHQADTSKVFVTEKPRFVRCHIVGPDGKVRPGWEMWLGTHCFGRADHKEILLRCLKRQQQPPQSFHWREVHRQRFARHRLAPSEPEAWELEEEDETPSEQ